jgi:CheY-like chemotaxis protein
VQLDVRVPVDPVFVNGDETRLSQVLGNLLHNAFKFTPAGGHVTLVVAVEDGRAALRVGDTGAGIAADVLPIIFEPFTQAQQTIARSEGGLGLGLALVKGLVALHGGEVRAHSAGSGCGTEFVVTLPLAEARRAVQQGPRRATEATERAPRRVLVVDDNHDAAETFAEIARMLGHDVDVAFDAFDGLARAADEVPDVVLCDIGLPGMDGYEFARQLRARAGNRRVRLIAVSGYAQSEDIAKAVEAGFDAHVAKPADPATLAQLLSDSA